MFYSHEILTSRKYGVATVWLVGTLGPTSTALKVKRKQILGVDVRKACETIIQPEAPMALRLQSSLLYGVSRVYNQQCGYVLHDAQTAQNNLRALLKAVKDNAIDLDTGAARPDQLMLMDDPAFEPGLALPSLSPLDFSMLEEGLKDSQYSMLSSLKSFNASGISNSSQASLVGLQIPPSDSDITGQFQLSGRFQLGSSAQKTPSGANPFDGDEPGLLDDLDFEFDADGAMVEVDAEELARRRMGVYPARAGRAESDSAASGRVRRDHEEALIGREDRLDDDGDFIMQMDDDMNILPDAEAFPQHQGAKPRGDNESSIEESSVSAEVPLKKKRQRKAVKVISEAAVRLDIRNSELSEWQTNYVQNMAKEKHAKLMRVINKYAVTNASIFVWGNGIGGIGKTIRSSGNFPHPLDIFRGDKLKELVTGIAISPDKGKKRARSAFGENDEEADRNVRARPELELQLPRAVEDDAFMPNFGDEMMPYEDDSTGIEVGREAFTPLADHHSSAMPWNVSASVNSFRQRSSSVVPGQGRHSSVVPSRPGSRYPSASPLLGRGRLLSDNELEFPARGAGSTSGLEDGEFEALGPSAAVDTQTAQSSQWVADALETESLNFLEFVKASHVEAEDDLESWDSQDADDGPKEKWVGFETLFPPQESHRIVAAQAFHHVLSLATKSLLKVTQEEGGEVMMSVKQ
ncbi:R8 protein [Pseudogymnoascus australis]